MPIFASQVLEQINLFLTVYISNYLPITRNTMMRTPGQVKFVNALSILDKDAALDNSILLSAASLRLLGVRVYTYFIDLLVQKDYYSKKAQETRFSPRYELEPVPLKLAGFSTRLGTVDGDLCSFRHLVKPYNIYGDVEYNIGGQMKRLKVRPRDYVRKDCDEAIEKLIQGSNETYWKDLYSYHKQIEAIDLGVGAENLKMGPQKFLKLD